MKKVKRISMLGLICLLLCTQITPIYAYNSGEEITHSNSSQQSNGLSINTNSISSTGSIVAEGADEASSYVWSVYNDETQEYDVLLGENNASLYIARDGAQKTYKVEALVSGTVETSTQKIEYYDELQNGGFENPDITPYVSGSNPYYQFKNGSEPRLHWLTTGLGTGNARNRDIEIVRPSLNPSFTNTHYKTSSAYEGEQFAEINAEAFGALYQDVLTEPGSTLYWSLVHRGRQGADTMYVVIADDSDINISEPSEVNEEYIQSRIKTGNTSWNRISGEYVVPEGQYITRFYFVAVETHNGVKSVGNLVDDVTFSCQKPLIEEKLYNYKIEYFIDGELQSTVDEGSGSLGAEFEPTQTKLYEQYDADPNNPKSVIITNDESQNRIQLHYTTKTYSYSFEYYVDGQLQDYKDEGQVKAGEEVFPQYVSHFDSFIAMSNNPSSLKVSAEGNNVVQLHFYKEYNYTIRYFVDNKEVLVNNELENGIGQLNNEIKPLYIDSFHQYYIADKNNKETLIINDKTSNELNLYFYSPTWTIQYVLESKEGTQVLTSVSGIGLLGETITALDAEKFSKDYIAKENNQYEMKLTKEENNLTVYYTPYAYTIHYYIDDVLVQSREGLSQYNASIGVDIVNDDNHLYNYALYDANEDNEYRFHVTENNYEHNLYFSTYSYKIEYYVDGEKIEQFTELGNQKIIGDTIQPSFIHEFSQYNADEGNLSQFVISDDENSFELHYYSYKYQINYYVNGIYIENEIGQGLFNERIHLSLLNEYLTQYIPLGTYVESMFFIESGDNIFNLYFETRVEEDEDEDEYFTLGMESDDLDDSYPHTGDDIKKISFYSVSVIVSLLGIVIIKLKSKQEDEQV